MSDLLRPALVSPVVAVLLSLLFLLSAVSRNLASRGSLPGYIRFSAPEDFSHFKADPNDQDFWPAPPLLQSPVPSHHPVRLAYSRLASTYIRPFLLSSSTSLLQSPRNCSFASLSSSSKAGSSSFKNNSHCFHPPPGRRILRSAYLLPYLYHRPSACPACVLIQVRRGRLYLHDPRGQRSHAAPFRAARLSDALAFIRSAVRRGVVRDTELVLSLADAPPVPSVRPHPFRLARDSGPPAPIFAPIRCAFALALPFPHMLSDARRRAAPRPFAATAKARRSTLHLRSREGLASVLEPYMSTWNGFVGALLKMQTPSWQRRRATAVFRGAVRVSAAHVPATRFHTECERFGRPALLAAARKSRGRLDVALTGACGTEMYNASTTSLIEQAMQFRYVVQAEGNSLWADRMAVLPFLPVAVLRQITPCSMFFEPLMRPLQHYVPVDFRFRNAGEAVDWLRENDATARSIASAARRFAAGYLSEAGVQTYVDELLKAYTDALETTQVEIMPGAVELTN